MSFQHNAFQQDAFQVQVGEGGAVQAPFAGELIGASFGTVYPITLRTFIQGGFAGMYIQAPFSQENWPLPPRAAPFIAGTIAARLNPAAPFKPSDLRLPTRAPLFTSATISARLDPTPPFDQSDWPLPKRSVATPQSQQSQSLNLTTLSPVASPFLQNDWPLPYRAKAPQPVALYVNPLTLNSELLPFNRHLDALPIVTARFSQAAIPPNFIFGPVSILPFAFQAWTIPARPAPLLDTSSQQNMLALTFEPYFDYHDGKKHPHYDDSEPSDDETPQERYVRELRKLRDTVSRRVMGLGPLSEIDDEQLLQAVDAVDGADGEAWRGILRAAFVQKQNDELAIVMLLGM